MTRITALNNFRLLSFSIWRVRSLTFPQFFFCTHRYFYFQSFKKKLFKTAPLQFSESIFLCVSINIHRNKTVQFHAKFVVQSIKLYSPCVVGIPQSIPIVNFLNKIYFYTQHYVKTAIIML